MGSSRRIPFFSERQTACLDASTSPGVIESAPQRVAPACVRRQPDRRQPRRSRPVRHQPAWRKPNECKPNECKPRVLNANWRDLVEHGMPEWCRAVH
jgi:hypothetical protein